MSAVSHDVFDDSLVRRICSEFTEMPGLRLSRKQAQRLWGLDEDTCGRIFEFLVEARFLRLGASDTYGRLTDGPVAFHGFARQGQG